MFVKVLLSAVLCFGFAPSALAAQNGQMAGGYKEIKVTDPGAKAAADFAVKTINKGSLVKIVSAKSQVVAGTNYELVLEIVGEDATHHIFEAVVFVPLPAANMPMKLSSSKDRGVVRD
jgi:hypothetical protein